MSYRAVRRGLVLFAVIFIAGSALAGANSEQQNYTTSHRHKTTTTDKRGSAFSPLHIKLLNTGKSDAEASQESAQINKTIILTQALVGATVLQFLALLYQGRVLHKTVGEMKRGTKAAETTAQAAIKTASIMESTAERQLRAYVHVESCYRIQPAHISGKLSFRITIKNFGGTPAYKCRVWMGRNIANAHFTGKLKKPIDEVDTSNILAAPNGEYTIESSHPIDIAPHINEFERGEVAVYVFGKIKYLDTFGKRRWTKFRFMYNSESVQDTKGQLVTCDNGNKTDEYYQGAFHLAFPCQLST